MLMRQDSSGVHYKTNNFQCQKKYVKVGKYAKQQITVLLIINTLDDKNLPSLLEVAWNQGVLKT